MSLDFLLCLYQDALRDVEQIASPAEIDHAHFSDTFILYSRDDTGGSYAWIQSVAKNFIRRCVCNRVPLRGAIAFGGFYADRKEEIYFGPALIEAYREAEQQDWIGLVLTETAEKKIQGYNLKPQRHQFRMVDIPTKEDGSVRRWAYDFHKNLTIRGRTVTRVMLVQALSAMKRAAPAEAQHKHQNTIDYLTA